MPDLGQAQTGSLRSTPKQIKMTASDKSAAMFKCMGNNHYVPFIWSTQAVVSGTATEAIVVDGVKFYDMELASYANVTATATSDPGDAYWVAYDTGANTIKVVVGSAVSADVTFNVQFILGPGIDISTLSTRGTGAPAQSYP
ncbi:MAG: hypothetical protein KAH05_08910 [Clostridiales bacterium]|nr:hypothetical protein [Clostridiales bacterium]